MQNNYIKTIYVGIIKKQTFEEVHKALLKATINQKIKGQATSKRLLKTALEQYKTIKQQITKEPIKTAKKRYMLLDNDISEPLALSLIAFTSLQLEKFTKSINEEAREREAKEKDEVIKSTLEYNRQLETPKIFYLASEHNDSAEDHKDYQGKMYIDKQWRSYIINKDLIKIVEKYLHTHKTYYFQWVIGKPVWFITRPNCRHYFKVLSINEVINTPKEELIEKYKMHRAIGNRQYVRTLEHSVSREWYADKRNAELLLLRYKNRLKIHVMLKQTYTNELIDHAIAKDKLLIAKWTQYLRTLK